MTESNERLHALDALRAIAMLLGIGLHAALAYQPFVFELWPADDPASSPVFNPVFAYIHLFRMEAFFFMAGFFGCMVLARRGPRRFAAHRLKRIALPLVIAMLTLIPLTQCVWAVGLNMRRPEAEQLPIADAIASLYSQYGGWSAFFLPVHLWFLEHLLLLYALFLAGSLAAAPLRPLRAASDMLSGAWAWCVRHGLAALPLAALAAPVLLLQTGPGADTQMGAVPPPRIVGYYAVYFGAGWFLYHNRNHLPSIARGWPLLLAIGTAISIPYMGAAARAWTGEGSARTAQLLAAPATAFLVVGFTGAFLRLCNRPSPAMRYIADSAYWMYLIHLPLVIALNWLAYPLPLPAIAKFTVVCGLAFAILLVSYHAAVRNTWLGVLLNGRRLGPKSTADQAGA